MVVQIQSFTRQLRRALIIAICFISATASAIASDNLPDNPEAKNNTKKGVASFYSDFFNGRKTANGEVFSQNKLTCASNVYPIGTWLRVTHLKSGKSVIVRVNDRMHPRMRRIVDLSRLAAEQLGMIKSGVAEVMIENLGKQKPEDIVLQD